MSKNSIFLTYNGTNYFLSGGAATQTVYAGSGTPWTAETTTPYEMNLNDASGPIWVPTPPNPTRYTYGGPPFAIGAQPFAQSYGNTTETLGIQMRGTTKDNAVFLLRQLRNILNAAVGGPPVLLGVTGGTNAAYFQIIGATVQETPAYIYELVATTDAMPHLIRATITWERTPFAGRLTTPETLISAVSYNQNDASAFSTGAGDLIYEGSPCNYTITPSSAPDIYGVSHVWLASTADVDALAVSSGGTISTTTTTFSSTTAARTTQFATLPLAGMITNPRLRLRLIASMSAASTNLEFRWRLQGLGGDVTSSVFTLSNPISITNGDGQATRRIDSGPMPVSWQMLRGLTTASSTTVDVFLQHRSTDGASATGTVTAAIALLYYDFCEIIVPTTLNTWANNAARYYNLQVSSFAEYSGYPCLPLPYPQAVITDPNASSELVVAAQIRGTVPRYHSGSSLWVTLGTFGDSSKLYLETRTFTVTATHAPLYRTLRAGG